MTDLKRKSLLAADLADLKTRIASVRTAVAKALEQCGASGEVCVIALLDLAALGAKAVGVTKKSFLDDCGRIFDGTYVGSSAQSGKDN